MQDSTFKAQHSSFKKIVLTGPESSGKTTLAKALAQALHTVWVPEFARPYVEYLGRPYEKADLLRIAQGQMAWEQWYAAQANGCLVCDTDLTVIQIWHTYKYGVETPIFRQQLLDHAADVYLLCMPDFAWVPDPLREHPEEREVLLGKYVGLLEAMGVPFFQVGGRLEERLEMALTIANGLLINY